MADGSFEDRDAAALLRKVPMSLWPEPARRRRTMLQLAAERAEKLLADLVEKMDALDPDPDLEPSLGSFNSLLGCNTDDREEEETDADFGGLGDSKSQLRWGEEGASEGDGDPDVEPSLGAALDLQGRHDQDVTWGVYATRQQTYRAGGQLLDIDDGAQCDDEGHDSDREQVNEDGDSYSDGPVPNYTSHHDQRTPAGGSFTVARGVY
jgi:hypothetical protein